MAPKPRVIQELATGFVDGMRVQDEEEDKARPEEQTLFGSTQLADCQVSQCLEGVAKDLPRGYNCSVDLIAGDCLRSFLQPTARVNRGWGGNLCRKSTRGVMGCRSTTV